ncbi:glycosyltransferase family protein [Amnibacterium endophyticum]|uniref:Spore protein YkvP/CgeB glycosyl transferase-like domain-containing protein n=1 Tax=Amnibacterium endophyticum TaxID=2109337 RepID=A0ABW4LAL3_9MICO
MSRSIRRILYVPNETGDARQFGYRRAFADLLSAGMLDEVRVFSLEHRIHAGGDAAAHRADLLAAAREFAPDLLFMQHLGRTGLTDGDFEQLTSGGTPLLYHEADPYTRRVHPLPAAARAAGRAADVVFTVGAGTFTTNFLRSGARRVEWTPSAFDPNRIDLGEGQRERAMDVVIIANRGRARIRPLPNAADRVRFIEAVQDRLGDRLALHGRGWSGPSARGPVPYSEQTTVLRSAWMSANWDHFAAEPCYFSDRLAIALASGSVFATTLHPGYSAVFPPDLTRRFLITSSQPQDLLQRIEQWLATTTVDQRLDAELAAREFAWSHLRQDDTLVTMLNAVGVGIDPRAASEAWDIRRAPLDAL